MIASFDIAHPILDFSSGLLKASLPFLSHPDRHFDGFSEQMISATTEVIFLEPIKPVKASNESSQINEIHALHISVCFLTFRLP